MLYEDMSGSYHRNFICKARMINSMFAPEYARSMHVSSDCPSSLGMTACLIPHSGSLSVATESGLGPERPMFRAAPLFIGLNAVISLWTRSGRHPARTMIHHIMAAHGIPRLSRGTGISTIAAASIDQPRTWQPTNDFRLYSIRFSVSWQMRPNISPSSMVVSTQG